MKQQINARLSESARDKLEFLSGRYGTQTTALEVAIDRLFQMEQGQQQWTIFELKQVDGSVIVDAIDELAYQAAIYGKPRTEYSGKAHRSDFVVWTGKKEDLPDIYRQ